MSAPKRPASGEWYTPYFAPTTVVVAAIVLFLSIEAGKYVGSYLIQRDKAAAQATTPLLNTTSLITQTPAKAATHGAPARPHAATAGKTPHGR